MVEEQKHSGGGFSAGRGDGEPSREFANAASSLLDEGLDDEVCAQLMTHISEVRLG